MDRNSATVGQIRGLLEAWGGYGTRADLSKAVQKCDHAERMRIFDLFNTLDASFIIREMLTGRASTRELFERIAHWR